MKLRAYQTRAIEKTIQALKDSNAQLLVAATGAGKTVIATHLFKSLPQFKSCLFIAHTKELIKQATNKFRELGFSVSVEMGDSYRTDTEVVVGSVQSLTSRLDTLTESFDLIIVDEAHHAKEKGTYHEIIKTVSHKLLFGITATPNRHDGQDLSLFNHIVDNIPMLELINTCRYCDLPANSYECTHRSVSEWHGCLVDLKCHSIPTGTDIRAVKKVKGDYSLSMLSKFIDTPERNEFAYKFYKEYGSLRSNFNIFFCVNVQHAYNLCKLFNESDNRKFAMIHGKMEDDERDYIIKGFANGDYAGIFNCNVLTEGFDAPMVDGIYHVSPTASTSRYIQRIGRVTRPYAGKMFGHVYDLVDVAKRHVTMPTLLGLAGTFKVQEDETFAKLSKKLERVKNENPLVEISEVIDFNELLKRVEVSQGVSQHYFSGDINWVLLSANRLRLPLQHGYMNVELNLLGQWEASFKDTAHNKLVPLGVSDNKKDCLEKAKSFIVANFPDQLKLLDTNSKWRSRAATFKQIQLLKRFKLHYKYNVRKLSSGQAQDLIDEFLMKQRCRIEGVKYDKPKKT